MIEKVKLKEIIKKNNILPKKRLGQNFIFDFNILNKIVKNIMPIEGLTIIEIGPGPGGLTKEILDNSPKELILIEKDATFKRMLENLIKKYPNTKTRLIIDDVLKINIDELIKNKTKLISNLPYYISSQILLKVIPLNKFVTEAVFTFQRELADRIVSESCTKSYSRLSVVVQSVCKVSKKQKLPATVFYPEPAVDSCVLKIEPKSNVIVKDVEILKAVTKKAFNQRRKKISNSLKKIENISFYLNKLGINENTRAEDIAVELYCDLANLILKKTNI
jgi:16S rRNA (adenine1518-N6/adenine1519-N6)-dimethyltransferase